MVRGASEEEIRSVISNQIEVRRPEKIGSTARKAQRTFSILNERVVCRYNECAVTASIVPGFTGRSSTATLNNAKIVRAKMIREEYRIFPIACILAIELRTRRSRLGIHSKPANFVVDFLRRTHRKSLVLNWQLRPLALRILIFFPIIHFMAYVFFMRDLRRSLSLLSFSHTSRSAKCYFRRRWSRRSDLFNPVDFFLERPRIAIGGIGVVARSIAESRERSFHPCSLTIVQRLIPSSHNNGSS